MEKPFIRHARALAGAIPALLLAAVSTGAALTTDGSLRMEVITAYNFVVDSNVESPSTNGPSAAHLGVRIYNDGATALTDVQVNIGSLTNPATGAGTVGFFPSRVNPQGYTGTLALQMPGGATDAVRSIPRIEPGTFAAQYFFVTYPLKDDLGHSVAGAAAVTSDDLWLTYDLWASASEGIATRRVDQTTKVTMRNEISAMANKIWPNTEGKVPEIYLNAIAEELGWRPDTNHPRVPGAIEMEGIWYDLGNVGAGFDNDGDGLPDRNAWMQPVGDPAVFSPLAARLVKCYGLVIVKLNDGSEQLIPFEDRLYFENIPGNNRGAVGLIYYEFIPLDLSKPSQLSPYQEVASGYDNEKFNGDYGASVGSVTGTPPNVAFDKSGPATVAAGANATYVLSATNHEAAGSNMNFGWPELGLPVVFQDSIPSGLVYVAGSATAANAPPAGEAFTVTWSTDGGATWLSSAPAAAAVTTLRWTMSGTLAPGQSAAVQFQASVPITYAGVSVSNTGCMKKGPDVPFACDTATTLVQGLNSLGDFVWLDLDRDGMQDGGSEIGIANIGVTLHYDADGNGVLDPADPIYASTETNASGIYGFANLPDGKFIAVVDQSDAQLPPGYSLPNSVTGAIAVSLDPTSTDPSAVDVLSVDWPFIPALEVTKTVTPTIYKEGELISYNIDLANHSSSVSGNVAPVQSGYVSALTSKRTAQNPANAQGAPNNTFGRIDYAADSDHLQSSGAIAFPSATGTITKVELVFVSFLTKPMTDDTLQVSVNGASSGAGYKVLGKTELDTLVGANTQTYAVDITPLNATWTWPLVQALTARLEAAKVADKDGATLWVDSIGFRVTTAGAVGTYGPTTIAPLPLTDTYDSTKLKFISASVAPTATSTAIPTAATLSWADLGPLNAGTRKSITVTFQALAPTAATTNSATAANAYFVSGRRTNDATSAVNVAITATGSIGDLVFWDLNGINGFDAGDVGIPNVVVKLYQPAGGSDLLVAQTLTDINGKYLFSGLVDGSYYVRIETATNDADFSLPWTTFNQTYDPDGTPYSGTGPTKVISNSDASATNDDYLDQDFGFSSVKGLISGTIFMDSNGNGVKDASESPISGLSVALSGGATTTTDADGYYSFGNLAVAAGASNYTVTVTPPVGSYQQTLDPDLAPGNTGGNNATTVTTLTTTSPAVYLDANNDFAYRTLGTGAIGNFVWLDADNDGFQDAGESGINGVTVQLYLAIDTPGSGTPYASTLTAGGGAYNFSNLPAGNYRIYLPASNFTAGNALAGTPLSSTTTGTSDDAINTDDNGIQSVSGAAVTSPVVTLAAGETDTTKDFGFTGTATLGNLVWLDTDNDGLKDTAESGINGVSVQLYRSGQILGTDTPYASTTTAGGGLYSFSFLPAGDYVVYLPASNFTGGGVLLDMPFSSTTTAAVDNSVDNDDNGIQSAMGGAVASPVINLTSGETDSTKDFGMVGVGSVGDFVFYDANANGQQDYSETGIAGVTVKIFLDANADGAPDAPGAPIASAVTANGLVVGSDPAGFYRFDNLPPNTYFVQVDIATLPQAMPQTSDPDRDGVPVGTAPLTPPGDNADSLVVVTSGSNYSGADFGYQPPGAIGDYVWLDLDQDGVQDSGEPGLAGVALSFTNGVTTYSVTTDFNGYWSKVLANGGWTVSVAASNFSAGGPLEDLVATYDADGITTLNSAAVTLAGGVVSVPSGLVQGNLGIDFGYKLNGSYSLSGTVAIHDTGAIGTADDIDDFANDGVDLDAGPNDETELSGIEVFLYTAGGDLLGTQFTDANGNYAFIGLPSGSYKVIIGTTAVPLDRAVLTTTSANNLVGSEVTSTPTSVTQLLTIGRRSVVNVDFTFNSTVNYDYGDLPSSYGMTTLSQDGARHIVPSGGATVYLGAVKPDADTNGLPTAQANGDDSSGSDDEDGVVLDTSAWTPDTSVGSAQVTVNGSGWLVAWIDWNHDGDLLDSGELIVSNAASTGTSTINFNIPVGTITTGSQSWLARFRLFTAAPAYPLFSYEGEATNGEVEDYLIEKTVGGSIGDRVWLDANGNGVQDAGEDGIGGIIVQAVTGTSTLTQTTSNGSTADLDHDGFADGDVDKDGVVDPPGYYRFRGLAAGTYTVTVTNPPSGFDPSYDEDGGVLAPNNTTAVILGAAVQHLTADFGYKPKLADISGQVRFDTDADGNPLDSDSGTMGVSIQLWTDPNGDGNPADGVQVRETLTDTNGNYSFVDVPSGNYVVVEITPTGSTSTYDVAGANDDRIPVPMAGTNVTGRDFLDTLVYAVSGFVYEDANADGIFGGDAPLAGVTVRLYSDLNNNGVVDGGEPLLATQSTGGLGGYSFSNIPNGNYLVVEIDGVGFTSVTDSGETDTANDNNTIDVSVSGAASTGNNFLDVGTCINDWAKWKEDHPAAAVPGANSDADAYDNLTEFAFAMSPDGGAGNAWWIQPAADGTLEGVFIRPRGALENVTYTLQAAVILGSTTTWVDIVIPPDMISVVDNGSCMETVTFHDLETLTGGKPFVRIKAELDEVPTTGIDKTSYTEVEGWKETPLALCCRTYNNPFLRETAFTGTVTAVAAQTISFASNVGLTFTPGSYYLEVTSGTYEGHRFDVVSASGTSVILATDASVCLATPPFNTLTGALPAGSPGTLVGASVVIRRHWTLGEMFPVSGFHAAADATLADQVQTYTPGTTPPPVGYNPWTTYWLFTNGGSPKWVTLTDGSTDQAASVIQPGQGLFVNKRSAITSVLAYGEVRDNDFIRPLCHGNNLVGGGYPLDQSATGAASRQMNLTNPGTPDLPVVFFGSRDFKTADSFFVWQGDASPGANAYDGFFLLNRETVQPAQIKWVQAGDVGLVSRDSDTTLFRGDSSVFIRVSSDLHTYKIPCPWTP